MIHPPSPDFSPVAWTTSDGTALTLRPIRADDYPIMDAFVRGLSFGTRYFRYGHGDLEFTPEELRRICSPDPRECVHLLILKKDAAADSVVASARIVFEAGASTCEVALTVADAWQLRGVGKRMINALFNEARTRGMTEMHARILASNRRMIEFMRRRGFAIADSADGPSVKMATLALQKM